MESLLEGIVHFDLVQIQILHASFSRLTTGMIVDGYMESINCYGLSTE